MSQTRIIGFCQRTVNIINCTQEVTYLFQHQGFTNKMNTEYLENYI